MSNAPPVMYKDAPGFAHCMEVFKAWNEHQSIDFDSSRITMMRNNHNASKVEDFFSKDEFKELTGYIVDNPTWHLFWEGGSALANVNPEFPNYNKIMALTVDRIKAIRGDFLIDNMFIRRAVNSLPLHTDHVYNWPDRVPSSTYVIPLAAERDGKFTDDWTGISTTMFEQYQYRRAYGADVFDVELKTGIPFLQADYKHVSQHTTESLDGLSLETVFEWRPGTMITMDAYRLHCSNDWKKFGFDSKWALIIQTAIELPSN
jgi:hypothetical protein